MNRKFILLTLTLISIICFSQTKDTIFLKKEKGHNIYKIQNRNSKMYNDLSNFKNFDEGKTEKIMKIGLNSKWIRIHKFNNEYFLYAPCDWCNDTKLQINDDFLQVSGCELIKEKIKSVKKINEDIYASLVEMPFKDLLLSHLEDLEREDENKAEERKKEEKVLNEKIEQKVATDSTPKDLKSNYNEEI
jgi:hypothetical protein